MPGRTRWSSTKRRGPATRSRTISSVHLSPTRSSARASGAHWLYGCRLGGGTDGMAGLPRPWDGTGPSAEDQHTPVWIGKRQISARVDVCTSLRCADKEMRQIRARRSLEHRGWAEHRAPPGDDRGAQMGDLVLLGTHQEE